MATENADKIMGGDTGDPRSLRELTPLFNDVSKHAPYLYAEVQVTVKIYLDHPETESGDGVEPGCKISIEAPAPSRLLDDIDPLFIASVERNITSYMVGEEEQINAAISLQEVIEAFNLDVDAPIWQLGYE